MIESDVEFYETEGSFDLSEIDEVREFWKIDGRATADWALAVVKRSETEKAEAKKLCEERIERAKAHLAEVEKREDSTIDYMSGKLREWYETYLTPEGLVSDKRKTYSNLENGSIGKRAGSLSLKVDDEEALVDYLKRFDLEQFVQVKETPMLSELKKAYPAAEGHDKLVDENGSVVPSAHYERGSETFVVKTS